MNQSIRGPGELEPPHVARDVEAPSQREGISALMQLLKMEYFPVPMWFWKPPKLLIAMVTGLYIILFLRRWNGMSGCRDCDMKVRELALSLSPFEAFLPCVFKPLLVGKLGRE